VHEATASHAQSGNHTRSPTLMHAARDDEEDGRPRNDDERAGSQQEELGAGAALAGAALYYRSAPLLAYAAAFMLCAHLFVVAYEEPALRAKFGEGYAAYCRRVSRWLPRA